MKIISAKYIYKDREYIKNSAILFDNKIVKIDTLENLTKAYPQVSVTSYENSVIYPGFINPHTHLEFSANRATLELGDFIEWLYSVFKYREKLINNLNEFTLEEAIEQMLLSGITTFGAISSFGLDMQTCKESKLRVVYFNEIIGSSASMVDALFKDFKMRLEESLELSDDSFYSAIAIHSAYSVHPFLLREVLKIAKEKNLLVTTHFLESPYEREWLESGSGKFRELFENFFNTSTPLTTIDEFLNAFKGIKTLFTHCTQATKEEIKKINKENNYIIHCPRSNRLLNCGKLDINSVKNLNLATDGLSSNYSLSILDELKSAIFMHTHTNPKELALRLIDAVTIKGGEALGLKVGNIKEDYFADFAIVDIPSDLSDTSAGSIALHSIINNNQAKGVYIGGQKLI